MAAFAEPFSRPVAPVVADLREFRARHLQGVLAAEEDEWLRVLHWDFRKSASLVRKFVDLGDLNGAALVTGSDMIGYAYFVFEEGKGLLGNLYVRAEHRTAQNEELLFNAVMDQIERHGTVPRVEGQIMMLSAPLGRPERYWTGFQLFRREFLSLALPAGLAVPGPLPAFLQLEGWSPAFQEEAAQLIPATYLGHVDSQINDQYRSVMGARKFLHNIMQFPGCGEFYAPASLAAFDLRGGQLCGMALSSMVAEDSGHITQVCVHPAAQGLGLGRELLRRAIERLEHNGCRTVSLTVTTENRAARMLYERMGFRLVLRFGAYVWEP